MKTIDEKTKTTLGAACAVGVVISAIIVWATRLEAKADRGVKADIRTHRLEKGMIRIQERLNIPVPAEEKRELDSDEEN